MASQNWVGDGWHMLGQFPFTGSQAEIKLTNYWTADGIYVVADALRMTWIGSADPAEGWQAY